MSGDSRHSGDARKSPARPIIRDACWIISAGVILGLTANGVSSRGLQLTRNYFPETRSTHGGQPPAATHVASNGTGLPATETATAIPNSPAERLKANGLQLVEGKRVEELTRDVRYQQELVVLIDARAEDHFIEGHIPGAYEFDRFHPEKQLATVVQACQGAEQVVVYCNGGECEDSEFAAMTLRDAGIPNEKLYVYAGGITDWRARNGAIETGPRQSPSVR